MLLEEIWKTSEVSEFPILTYTQNRKLGNLGKFSFTSNFDSSGNLRCKNKNKKISETKSRYAFRRKTKNSRDIRVFDFDLYPKLKTRKSWKVFFQLEF